jgi:dGTPase
LAESDRLSRFYSKHARSVDFRSPYEHDYDRIIYSSYLRRLASVTQIFNPSEGVIFHNRLTHTIKVSQIANRIAQKLINESLDANEFNEIGGLNRDVVSAAALAHDLGNPPFGHAAESELDSLIKNEDGIVDGFEGNAQSFRIVTVLATHNENYPGLNLTRATLNAILKYPWTRKKKEDKKFGVYSSEIEYFNFSRELASNLLDRKCLEASIMDIADDITYAIHDLTDLLRQGLIPFEKLSQTSSMIMRHGESPFIGDRVYPQFSMIFNLLDLLGKENYQEEWAPNWTKDRTQIATKVTTFFKRFDLFFPSATYDGYRIDAIFLKEMEDYFIGSFLNNIVVNRSPKLSEPVLILEEKAADELIIIKAVAKNYILNSTSLIKQQCGERKIIKEIYHAFKDAIKNKEFRIILPTSAREELRILDINDSKDPRAIRIIADSISNLTDNEAISTYHVLTGIRPGSIFDRISI